MNTTYKLQINIEENKLECVKNIYKDCEIDLTDLINCLIHELINSNKYTNIIRLDNKLEPLVEFINTKYEYKAYPPLTKVDDELKEEQRYWSNKLDAITNDYQKYQQKIVNNNTKVTKQYLQLFNNDLKQIEPKLKELNILNLSNVIISLIDQTITNADHLIKLSAYKGQTISSDLTDTVKTRFYISYNPQNIKKFQKWYKNTIKE